MDRVREKRRIRAIRSIFSVWLILTILAGGFLGPTLSLRPASSQAAPLAQTVQLTKEEQSDFSEDGYVSYGEIITYTLQYELPPGTYTNLQLDDLFGDQANFLRMSWVTSTGPIAGPGTPPADPVTPVVDDFNGRLEIHWDLGTITVPGGDNYTYQVRYWVLVRWDQNGNQARKAINDAALDWDEGGPVEDSDFEVTLRQPSLFDFSKTQNPDPSPPDYELNPGTEITWTLDLFNTYEDHQGTAYDLYLTDTMPVGTNYIAYSGPYSPTRDQNELYWYVPTLAVSDGLQFKIYASLPPTGNVAHAPLFNIGELVRSSCPGNCPEERKYYIEDDTTAYVRNVLIDKAQESKEYPPDNADNQAVAGELITVTVTFTVPQGTIIYNPRLRLLLEDGLSYVHMISPTDEPNQETNPPDQDPYRPAGRWTQLQWPWRKSITDTDSISQSVTYQLVIRANQERQLEGGEINHATLLDIVPILRWTDDPEQSPPPDDEHLRERNAESNPEVSVQFIRPDLRYQGGTNGSYFTYTFGEDEFSGNALISFTLHLHNRTGGVQYPPAYDTVFFDHLCPELTYKSATPPPDEWVELPGLGTFITWTVTPPVTQSEHLYTIVAQLPYSLVAGATVTSTAIANYTTFSGTVENEGHYLDDPFTAQSVVAGGFDLEKSVSPADAVGIGDVANYVITLTLNPGLTMYHPSYYDTLPLGFHYVEGSIEVVGSSVVTGVVTSTAGLREMIHWGLDTVDSLGESEPIAVVIRYQAQMTGYDTEGSEVYVSNRGQFVAPQRSVNQVGTCWHVSSAEDSPVYCLEPPFPQADTFVVQPYLADIYGKDRPEGKTAYEIGETVRFRITLNNSGAGDGYDIVVTDTLPAGIEMEDSWLEGSEEENLIDEPDEHATGVVSWTLGQIEPDQTIYLWYDTTVLSTAIPGITMSNIAYIAQYTSQPGEDNPYDRHYKKYDNAFPIDDPIPDPDSGEPFFVRGLTIDKVDDPDPVAPGGNLTYRIEFGNSSLLSDTYNVLISDTYDPHLTYAGSDFNYPIEIVIHYPVTRTILWSVANIPSGGEMDDYWIDAHFTVDQPMDQRDKTLVNWVAIDGEGDLTSRVERKQETTVIMPFLDTVKTFTTTDPQGFVKVGDRITYTLVFSNTGPEAHTAPATDVWVEENYDPNVSFVEATPSPDEGTNRWSFGDILLNESYSITVIVQVNDRVPSSASEIVNSFTLLCNEIFPVTSSEVINNLSVPILSTEIVDLPDPVERGEQLAYTFNYINNGIDATNVVLESTFDPNAATFIGEPTPLPDPWPCVNNLCHWDLGDLLAGVGGSISVLVEVDEDMPPGDCQLFNTVTIESDQVGPRATTETTLITPCQVGIYLPVVMKGHGGQ